MPLFLVLLKATPKIGNFLTCFDKLKTGQKMISFHHFIGVFQKQKSQGQIS